MRAGDLLRQIDRRLLPLLADAVARFAQRPVRPQLLGAVVLLSVSAVLVTAVWAADHGRVTGVRTMDDVVRVGVAEGESIPDYLQAVRSELAAMSNDDTSSGPVTGTYALVTLTDYLPPQRLAAVLSGVSVVEVYTRVPLRRTPTQVVRMPAFGLPADVLTGMDQVAERKSREARDYRRRAAELGRAAELDLWTAYDAAARVATAEAEAYRAHCACVYAAVVQGSPAALRTLAGQVEIRAVDPAPEVRRLDRAVFLPPLPEYDQVVPTGAAALTSAGLPPGMSDAPAAGPGSTGRPPVPYATPGAVETSTG
ncbi:hypothetical protein ACN27F_30425 [Solwaraspora sp. WMMB335]|uniref:hypothetical protein n=1 Tax=Solwaraspora sp. WMMB335 TaxID=3404118 RepID=UPI003B937477